MVAVPLVEAYCVRLPAATLNEMVPRVWVPTFTLGMVTAGVAGLVSVPEELKVKGVPTLVHSALVPVALGADW